MTDPCTVFYQIETLAEKMKDPMMIDPVEFGEIKGAVASLQSQMADFKSRQAVIDVKLDMVLERLSEAKGGWKVMLMFGGAASTMGAGLTWFLTHVKA